jgi:hypothetical protein
MDAGKFHLIHLLFEMMKFGCLVELFRFEIEYRAAEVQNGTLFGALFKLSTSFLNLNKNWWN